MSVREYVHLVPSKCVKSFLNRLNTTGVYHGLVEQVPDDTAGKEMEEDISVGAVFD